MPDKLSKKVIWPGGGRSEVLNRHLQSPLLLLHFLVRSHFAPGSSSAFETDGRVVRLPPHQAISRTGSIAHFGERIEANTEIVRAIGHGLGAPR
jgi:hypothetical protein